MPTFIDESGCTGHGDGAKPYFRLTATWMPANVVEAFRSATADLRKELRCKDDFELKFYDTHNYLEGRRRFIHLALTFPFSFAFACVDKMDKYWRNASHHEIHWATATSLAVYLRATYVAAEAATPDRPLHDHVIVDKNDDPGFLDAIEAAFHAMRSKRHPGLPFTRKPQFRKSHADAGLLLTDMICGSMGAQIDGDKEWATLFRDRCCSDVRLP